MDSATILVIPTSLRRLMPLQEGARAVDGKSGHLDSPQ
jgi:hypothetical protein